MGSYAWAPSTTTQKDLRSDWTGANVGQVAGPGGAIANPGSIAMGGGDYSTLNLNLSGKFKSGLTGAEVNSLLQQQGSLAESAIGSVKDFANASLAALAIWRKS